MRVFPVGGGLLMVAATLSLAGCGASDLPEYSLGFSNQTATEIVDSRADWTTDGTPHSDGGGVLSPGSDAVSHEDPRPIPHKITVTWRTEDGKRHVQEVEVAKLIRDPISFSGTIFFKFTADDQVTVIPLSYKEIERRAARHETYP